MKPRVFISPHSRIYILLLLAVVAANAAAARNPDIVTADTLRGAQRTDRFYDSLAVRAHNTMVTRLLYDNLFRNTDSAVTAGRVVDEQLLYEPFRGKRIASITIVRNEVFGDSHTRLARWADDIHILTRHWVVKNYLISKVGDRVDPAVIVKEKQLLTSADFIYRTWIDMSLVPGDTTAVDMTVTTRDKWTLGADLDIDPMAHSTVEIYDANILGFGHRLSIGVNFSDNPWQWGGVMAGYTMPNLFGTFIRGEFNAGVNFDNEIIRGVISKDIILPTDYAGGVSYTVARTPTYQICYDTTAVIGLNTVDGWLGGALYVPGLRSSLFATAHFYKDTYTVRPDVAPYINPAYYNATRFMMGAGLFREKFYTTTLIYGYGKIEYLPSGYKAQLVGGYSWEQFSRDYYMGGDISWGAFSPNGSYFTGGVSAGSFLSDGVPTGLDGAPLPGGVAGAGRWNRSSVSAELGYVTRLFSVMRRSHLRNLSSLGYIHGWNRMEGCDEMVGLAKDSGIRGFSYYVTGRNRLVLNNETVLFTPWSPYGFRIAVFGYSDLGLIGDNDDVFNNNFFGTVGCGIRIHNDRLIFPAFQIRLGVFFGKPGFVNGNWISIASQRALQTNSFIPRPADIEPFR